ncbi:DNA primase family protein [Verrucomicrobiota bacterium sgz303538]
MSSQFTKTWPDELPEVTPHSEVTEQSADKQGAEKRSGPFPANDSERAGRFAELIRGNLRYVAVWKTWFAWDETRWVRDEGEHTVTRYAQQMPRILFNEADAIDDASNRKSAVYSALRSGDKGKLEAMIQLARHQQDIATEKDVFDRDPLLLGVQNGVVDLRTGTFRKARQEDFITKQAGVEYKADAQCPEWLKFLDRVLKSDSELIGFVQRAVGYSLTGLTSEQALFFLYGTGRNGKSTFTETLRQLMGDYGRRAPTSLFIANRNGNQPEKEIADLVSARFVVGSELDEGCRFDEARIKDLTGQDSLVGRFLYSHQFEFKPTHKLWIFGNHKPEIRGSDFGIWRRLRLLHLEVQIADADVDHHLPQKLLAELPGILNWAIEGCLAWQKHKLGKAESVTKATEEYKTEEDVLGQFITDRCVQEEGERVERGELYSAYKVWALVRGIKNPLDPKKFAKGLQAKSIKGMMSCGFRFWLGLRLREENDAQSNAPMVRETQSGIDISSSRAGQSRN